MDVVTNDRVVTTGSRKDDHTLIIIKRNDDPDEYEDDETIYEYSALRVANKSLTGTLARHLERHPDMEILLRITYTPNSMNLWTRVKNELSKGKNKKIDVVHCNFNLHNGYTERKLISRIKQIHRERFDTDDV
jgi:hypothetical protein